MAGSRKGNRGSGKRSGSKRGPAPKDAGAGRPPAEYAREAMTEWGKAVRHAASALRPARGPRLKQLLAASSKLGAGTALLERIRSPRPSSNGNAAGADDSWDREMPIPIQESMEVAVPVRTAYALATRFEDYPEFLDRIDEVEEVDESTVAFQARVRGARRRIEIEIVDERPNRRIDWEGGGAVAHSGVISFHELAPTLTHVELTIDLDPQNVLQRLTRAAHLTERAIRADMHRFKAYAELWQEDEDAEPPDDDELEDEEASEDEEEPEPVEAG